jgi:uncharacterized protein YecA (UPF0149 family)
MPKLHRSLFLPDPALSDTGKQIDNIRKPLVDDAKLSTFINAANAIFDIYNRGERASQFGRIAITRDEYAELQRLELQKTKMMSEILISTPGRNDLCRCGSGIKWKKCHGR